MGYELLVFYLGTDLKHNEIGIKLFQFVRTYDIMLENKKNLKGLSPYPSKKGF